ncbi:hypothetical protein ABPG72_022763 [Tetrahymena utriculariae]
MLLLLCIIITLSSAAQQIPLLMYEQICYYAYSSLVVPSSCGFDSNVVFNKQNCIQYYESISSTMNIQFQLPEEFEYFLIQGNIVFSNDTPKQVSITINLDQNTAYQSAQTKACANQNFWNQSFQINKTLTSLKDQFNLAIEVTGENVKLSSLQVFGGYQEPICGPGCQVCQDSQNCQTCRSSFNKITNASGYQVCQLFCNPDQYIVSTSGSYKFKFCKNCSPNCLSCANENSCNTCQDGYEYISSNSLCYLKCQSNQYRDGSNVCQNCIDKCDKCSSGSNCASCQTGYEFLNIPRQCALKCLSNQYRDASYVCQNCINNCDSCTKGQSCTTCSAGYEYLSTPKICSLNCLAQQYRDDSFVCQNCINYCNKCSNGTNCITCQAGYSNTINPPSCLQICASNQYRDSNQMCQNCFENCLNCLNDQSCKTCQSGFTNKLNPLKCVPNTCASNQYRDSNQLCQNCVQNCLQCENQSSCTTCLSGYSFNSQAGFCTQVCNSNQYLDLNYICQNCDQSCNTCSGPNNSDCKSCKSDWFQLNSFCYQWCPNNYITDTISQSCVQCVKYTKSCQSCANTCRSCQFGNYNQCLDCYQTMYLQNGTCNCNNNIDKRNIFFQCSNDNVAVLQATLASDSPTMTIEFGVPLNQITSLNCNQIFEKSTLDLLGSSVCSINSSQIIIQLSDDSYIMSNDSISMTKNVLQYQYSNSVKIDTFYLVSFEQLKDYTPQVVIQYDNIQSTCNDIIFKITNTLNDAKRGFYSFSWSVVAVPTLDLPTQAQLDTLLNMANSKKSKSLIINKYLIPSDTLITVQLDYTLKVNYVGVQQSQTQIQAWKNIIINSIQSRYPPIYRYMDLFMQFSFYIETCDQTGQIQYFEPLDIQINSQALPQLNQNINQLKVQEIELDIKRYQLPSNSNFDLQVRFIKLILLIQQTLTFFVCLFIFDQNF